MQEKPTVSNEDLADLFPGREVVLDFGNGAKRTVKVYPLGVRHLPKFRREIVDVVKELWATYSLASAPEGTKPEDAASANAVDAQMIAIAVPIVLEHMTPILADCVEGIDLNHPSVPAYVWPTVAAAWIAESFGEAHKIRPWVALVEETMKMLTGQKLGLWEKLSRSSSPPASTSA